MITTRPGGAGMVSIEQYSRIVGAIHAAAITPEHWIEAMTLVREALDATASGLIIADGDSRAVKSASLAPEAMAEYKAYYRDVDYVLEAVERGPVGLLRDGASLVALNACSEFNADWMRPHDMQDGLFVRLTDGARPTCFLVAAPQCQETFATPEHVGLVNALIPHLQQALHTHAYLTDLTMQARDAAGAIDGMRHAVLVVGPGAELIHRNEAADALLAGRDGLFVRAGRLTAGPTATDAELLRSVAASLDANTHRGNSFTCQRLSRKMPYVVHITPFTTATRDDGAARALVVVVDPDADAEPTPELLRGLFGLTRAESDVALMVARGHGLQPISDQLSLSLATVKTHLQHVFAKTATHRQAELVRLLLGLVP